MKFVKTHNGYWEWDESTMRLFNRSGGHCDVDENSPEWINATIVEAEDWHDLYLKTGWTDLKLDTYKVPCLWVAPDGGCWVGDCHEVNAEEIAEVIFGEDVNLDYAGDFLISHGWIKLSDWMYVNYIESHMYKNITNEQFEVISDWCKFVDLPIEWFVEAPDN